MTAPTCCRKSALACWIWPPNYAVCTVLTESGGRLARPGKETLIRVSRMRPTSTGYRLVTDVASQEVSE